MVQSYLSRRVMPDCEQYKISLNEDKTNCIICTKKQTNIKMRRPFQINEIAIKGELKINYFRRINSVLGPRWHLTKERKVTIQTNN